MCDREAGQRRPESSGRGSEDDRRDDRILGYDLFSYPGEVSSAPLCPTGDPLGRLADLFAKLAQTHPSLSAASSTDEPGGGALGSNARIVSARRRTDGTTRSDLCRLDEMWGRQHNPRKERGLQQRLYLLSEDVKAVEGEDSPFGESLGRSHRDESSRSSGTDESLGRSHRDEREAEYSVMGTTGNVYSVRYRGRDGSSIDGSRGDGSSVDGSRRDGWSCTCPDFVVRGNRCKHCYFVQCRVLKVDEKDEDVVVWKAIDDRISTDRERRDHYAAPQTLERYRRATELERGDSKTVDEPAKSDTVKKYVGESCAVCLEDMSSDDDVVVCEEVCGNAVHADCFRRWSKDKTKPTCVYCRNPLQRPAPSRGTIAEGGLRRDGEYLNLLEGDGTQIDD